MRRWLISFATIVVALGCGFAVQAQQLPAGTREADDTSRQDAVNARIRDAESALEKQDYKGAAIKLKALAMERPKDGHVLYDLGFAEERTGDEDGATQAYANAIAADPSAGEPRVALGLMDARAGRMDKAHQELMEAARLQTAAKDLRARALRALASMDETSHPDAAREELLAAVQLTGETPGDVLMGADLAAQAGDDSDAETAYRRALTTDAQNVDAISGLGHALVREKKFAEAETLLSTALKTHPDDPRLVSELAAAYAEDGKAAQAIPLMEKLRASQPGFDANESTMRLLARLYAMNAQYTDAGKIYEVLIGRDATDPELLDDLGNALVMQQRYGEAEAVLTKAVGMRDAFASPQDWAEAEGHLAFAASKNKDPRSTLQAVAERATVLPNSPASLFLEAISYDSLHQSKDAEKAYRAFLTVASGNSKYANEEFEARHRLIALEHEK